MALVKETIAIFILSDKFGLFSFLSWDRIFLYSSACPVTHNLFFQNVCPITHSILQSLKKCYVPITSGVLVEIGSTKQTALKGCGRVIVLP